jgi:hypothetical protein
MTKHVQTQWISSKRAEASTQGSDGKISTNKVDMQQESKSKQAR